MTEFVTSHELNIRIVFFIVMFGVIAVWEVIAPRRKLIASKSARWINNLGVIIINTMILRLIFPAAVVGFAAYVETQGWGVLNNLKSPVIFSVIVSVILMDAIIYFQHVMFHAVPILWRLHRVHHADLDIDATTGVRFHPIEIILSMLIKMAAVLILGPPVVAVVIFEVLLNASSLFNHGNIYMSKQVDKFLRWFVVTPDMHRVHHSIEADETNSNFGFNLPWWDHLFGTYRDQPNKSHEQMTIGIKAYRDAAHCIWLTGMMVLPFINKSPSLADNNHDIAKSGIE